MKYTYKLHGKPEISGGMAEEIYNDLAHHGFLPGRFTCGWRETSRTGWIEVCPEKISVVFTLEAENAAEFFGVLEQYKKCIDTKKRMTYEESSAISGEIYRKMLEQCGQTAKEEEQ